MNVKGVKGYNTKTSNSRLLPRRHHRPERPGRVVPGVVDAFYGQRKPHPPGRAPAGVFDARVDVGVGLGRQTTARFGTAVAAQQVRRFGQGQPRP